MPLKKFLNLLTSETAVEHHVVSVLAEPIVLAGRAKKSEVESAREPTIAHARTITSSEMPEVFDKPAEPELPI